MSDFKNYICSHFDKSTGVSKFRVDTFSFSCCILCRIQEKESLGPEIQRKLLPPYFVAGTKQLSTVLLLKIILLFDSDFLPEAGFAVIVFFRHFEK